MNHVAEMNLTAEENAQSGRILLAPMEGVVDFEMREMLTRVGSFDRCVTEFVRVTQTLLPESVFLRYCPELTQGSRTSNGTPVYVQLLGGDPLMMAANARRAAEMGSAGIDLNFGCPAKCVNRHDGGSILLQEPHRVKAIVQAVRDAVPATVPVTVKIRLGVRDSNLLAEVCAAIEQVGANELCIHTRTREDGYKPPAYWSHTKSIREMLSIPLVVNGEVWNTEDADKARHESQCADVMLGRGSLACPDLSRQIRARALGQEYTPLQWLEVLELVQQSFNRTVPVRRKYIGDTLKQWLVYLKRQYPEAERLFQTIKQFRDSDMINKTIDQHRTKDIV